MTSFEVVSYTMGVLRTIFCSGETEKSEINIKKPPSSYHQSKNGELVS